MDTHREIFSAFLIAKLLGAISPNISKRRVITQVATHTATEASIHELAAIPVAITVAKAAVNVFTKLFQIRIVMRSLSLLCLINFRSFDQNFHSFTRASILCEGKLIKASSVPEKNPNEGSDEEHECYGLRGFCFVVDG